MEQLGSHRTDFNEIWSLGVFRGCVGKIQVSLKSDKSIGYSTRKPLYIYGNFSLIYSLNEKCFRQNFLEKSEGHFTFQLLLFGKSRLLWDNMEKYGRDRQHTKDNIIWRMCIACCIAKTTDTHSEYEVLIAFSWQQWLRERTALLCVYIRCPFCMIIRPSLPYGVSHQKRVCFLFFTMRATCPALHFKTFFAKCPLPLVPQC